MVSIFPTIKRIKYFYENDIVVLLLALLFICSGMALSYGQTSTLFSTDSQLSSSLINQVFQDSKGIIWVATENGLNRYDGAKFVQYKHKEQDSTSILNNYVKHIFETRDGNLFFGFLNGIQYYNQSNHKFYKIQMLLKTGEEAHPHVANIIERHDGTLLASTGNGIFQLQKKGNGYTAFKIYSITASNYVRQLFEDHLHNLWIITIDQGLIRLKDKNKQDYYFTSEKKGANLYDITEDNAGNIFVGSLEGLYKLNKRTNDFEIVKLNNIPVSFPVMDLYANGEDEILIGTESSGLKIYHTDKNELSEINPTIRKFDFSRSKVHSVIKDQSGNLWIGIYQRGVMMVPPKPNNFNYIGYQSVYNTISSTYVSAIYKDHKNILWVGTDGDGVFGINPDGTLLTHITKGPKSIMTIFEDSHHKLWIGTYLNGLTWLDRETGTFHSAEETIVSQTPFPEHVLSIVEDSDNNLWLGTLGAGLYRLNLRDKQLYQMNSFSVHNELHNVWINCLLYTNKKIYIGTYYGLTSFQSQAGYRDFLPDNPISETKVIYSLYEDKNQNLWIGTSEGLYCMPKGKTDFIKYTENDGLCNNIICAIEEDTKGNLWISTHHGLSRFNPETNRFTNYYSSDGLQGNEFSRGSSFISKDGLIYFGGINGITYFDPDKIIDEGKTPDVRITSLYVQNKEITPGLTSGSYTIINKNITEAQTIQLAANDNTFTVELATNNFIAPERLTYFYSLNGQEWKQLPTGANNITFNDLQPGSYTLNIKVQEYENFSPEKSISIIIYPPWYASLWAIITYITITMLVIVLIYYQLRQRHLTKERIREEQLKNEINEAKVEFFINISHDIRTPISLITNPLKKLLTSDFDNERQRTYQLMKRNLDKILQLINQLIDIRKIDKGQLSIHTEKTELIGLLKEISLMFEIERQNKNIQFELIYPKDKLYAMVDVRYFDNVIQNVLSNAYKFTADHGHIKIIVDEIVSPDNLPQIRIIIQDNGKGILDEEKELIFERFYQGSDKKEEYSGAGIGLHLSRSIIQLHGGTIHAENNVNKKGTMFIIDIPQGIISESEFATTSTYQPERMVASQEQVVVPKVYSKSKYRILIVDDDKDIRQFLQRELEGSYHIITCNNGKDGLIHVLQQMPDLIISDVKMPVMDGINLCRKVKQNININFIPVILLTAKSAEKDYIEGLNIGADAYILKPFNLEILKTTIQNILQNRNLLKNTFSGNQIQEEKLDVLELTSSDEKLIQRITDYVNLNLNNPDLSVEMMSNEIGISRVHLYRKLKELTNQSTRDFIKNVRLKQAGELLANKKLSVQEVSYAVGFTNVSNFSTNFKEFYGIAPKFYAEEHLKTKQIKPEKETTPGHTPM